MTAYIIKNEHPISDSLNIIMQDKRESEQENIARTLAMHRVLRQPEKLLLDFSAISFPNAIIETFGLYNTYGYPIRGKSAEFINPQLEQLIQSFSIPVEMWMPVLMCEIRNYDTRIFLLDDLVAELYFWAHHCGEEHQERLADEYLCLAAFYRKARQRTDLYTWDKFGVPRNDSKDILWDWYHVLTTLTPIEMVALAQSIAKAKKIEDDKQFEPQTILCHLTHLFEYTDYMVFGDVIRFCHYLLLALSEKMLFCGINHYNIHEIKVGIQDLPTRFRNECFDIYIESHCKDIIYELESDNERLFPPTQKDAMQVLLQKEEKVVQDFIVSRKIEDVKRISGVSFDDENIKLANLFIDYLKNLIVHPKSKSTVEPPTIIGSVPRMPYCTYIVPNAPKTRDEIEYDIERAAGKSAQTFANLLTRYKEKGYLDFRGESPHEVYEYMKERYLFDYTEGNFTRYFKG